MNEPKSTVYVVPMISGMPNVPHGRVITERIQTGSVKTAEMRNNHRIRITGWYFFITPLKKTK